MALIHNPMAELTGPLHRVEAALSELSGDLGALEVLPTMNAGIERTNERLARVEAEVALTRAANERAVEALDAIRGELAQAVGLLAGGARPGPVGKPRGEPA